MKIAFHLFFLCRAGLEQMTLWIQFRQISAFLFSILFICLFSFQIGASQEDVVFELKRERKQPVKRKKAIPQKFKRWSFAYSKDFVIFNEKSKPDLKPGTVLKIHIPYPLIASFSEEFPIYGIAVSPLQGIVSGKIRGVKDTNRASLSFDEIIISGKVQSVQSFPVFLEGDLKEALFKDIALGFFESLPSVLALALRERLPQPQIQFINTDLKNKMEKLSVVKKEREERMKYLEVKNPGIFQAVIK